MAKTQTIRKLIKWPTKRRKCGARVWKKKWVTVPVKPKSAGEKPAEKKG